MAFTISLSKNDWSLHRKGPADQARHNEKVREAIKGNLSNIISQEAIITSDGNKIVKVPIRSLELPRFRYDFRKKNQVGQGEGESKPGDNVGQGQPGQGQGRQAGDQPGIDYFEAEVTIEEIASLLFDEMGLPNLEQKQAAEVEAAGIKYNDIHKIGIMGNLDKRRTIMENIRRNALVNHDPTFQHVTRDDLRFRTWNPDVKRDTNAVVIAMRDVSASMGEFEKYITRSFYFWMVKFLRRKYNAVKIVFITHHTEAKEVDEETFFKLGESGGTKVSSAYKLALDVIEQRYDPQAWNIYPFHFSDGDNWGDGDNKLCVELVNKLISVCNIFGYGEIQESRHSSPSTLMSAFLSIQSDRFIPVTIADKADVYPALRKFFTPREAAA
ncbi:MAG: sporulation protein YhbH [Chloroflexi bacterium]|nr:sporulation protein YhbH [Chloroflexota bacterium]